MKVFSITSMHMITDLKYITCALEDKYENYPETLRFLGEAYVKIGWSYDRNEVYYEASRTPVPFN